MRNFLAPDRNQRLARERIRDPGGKSGAINRQRMSGGDGALASDLQQPRSRPPHFFFQQPGRRVLAVGLQRVRADQFREIRGLMRRCGAHRTHLPKFDRNSAPRALPRCFRSRQPGANDFYRCRSSRPLCHLFQRVSVQAHSFPVVQKSCAQALIEVDRRSIPVEHLPAHAKAILFSRHRRHSGQQRLANSLSRDIGRARRCPPERVRDDPRSWSSSRRRAHSRQVGRPIPPSRTRNLGASPNPSRNRLASVDRDGEALEFGKFMNERIQRGHIAGLGWTN